MQTTITIELDQELLQKAEAWATRHQLSLSEAIANLLQQQPELDPFLQQEYPHPSLASVFEDLRQICQEENYRLEIPVRGDRAYPFA
jgi:hypothetical protein